MISTKTAFYAPVSFIEELTEVLDHDSYMGVYSQLESWLGRYLRDHFERTSLGVVPKRAEIGIKADAKAFDRMMETFLAIADHCPVLQDTGEFTNNKVRKKEYLNKHANEFLFKTRMMQELD